MTRLIDADKINFKWINGVICVEPKDIEKMPTVDAIPVEWIERYDEEEWMESGTPHTAVTKLLEVWHERKDHEQTTD